MLEAVHVLLVLPLPKRVMLLSNICLFFCLSVCQLLHVKATNRIFTKIFARGVSKDKEELFKFWN